MRVALHYICFDALPSTLRVKMGLGIEPRCAISQVKKTPIASHKQINDAQERFQNVLVRGGAFQSHLSVGRTSDLLSYTLTVDVIVPIVH